LTIEEFRGLLASREPVPAGVSLAALTASLALSLFEKVLGITRHRKDFRGDPRRVDAWMAEAHALSEKLARCADDDVAAYREYMARRKSPEEAAALRKAIEVPLEAARAAAAGLRMGLDAAAIVPASIKPDLGTAASLLAGAVRGIARSIESNVQHVSDPKIADEVRREVRALVEAADKIGEC